MADGDYLFRQGEPAMQEGGLPPEQMSETTLLTFLDEQERDSLGFIWGGQLSFERALAQKYYLSEPYGNEVEGRSDVVSTEVFDTVEWMLPALVKVFASTDKSVEFEPQSIEDSEAAKQATDACNYVFWKQNDGFLITYTWFKDALLQKNGAVKWYWEKKKQIKRSFYRGQTIEQLQMYFLNNPSITILSQQQYPDPIAQQNPQFMAAVSLGQMPIPMLYDVEIEYADEIGKVCIVPIPPEELIVSRNQNSLILDDCPFVEHICKKTLSDLRDQGYEFKDDEIQGDAPTNIEMSPEAVERRKLNEDSVVTPISDNSIDPAQRTCYLREIYCLVDFDGDGIAERRRIIRAGRKIFENEPCDGVQIAAITPNIIQHRFFGMSVAEMVMDLQLLKSTLWRSMVDNLFHANNQGHIVLASADGRVQANVDDLLNSRPGRLIREYSPNAVRPEAIPFIGNHAWPMMEYIDQQRQNRTGANNLTSGLEADSLNKTARGAVLAQNKMQEKIELIARIFAECGFKPMFRGISQMLSKYSMRPLAFKLRNKFVQYDPRGWSNQFDMSINVGLGTGNKDQQLMHLQQILATQMGLLQTPLAPLVTPQNVYNTNAKMVENAGFPNVEEFFTDPQNKPISPPPPPPVDPIKVEETKIKGYDAQTKRLDVILNHREAQVDHQLQARGQLMDSQKSDREMNLKEKESDRPKELPKSDTKVRNTDLGNIEALVQQLAMNGEQGNMQNQAMMQALLQAISGRQGPRKGTFNGKPFEIS